MCVTNKKIPSIRTMLYQFNYWPVVKFLAHCSNPFLQGILQFFVIPVTEPDFQAILDNFLLGLTLQSTRTRQDTLSKMRAPQISLLSARVSPIMMRTTVSQNFDNLPWAVTNIESSKQKYHLTSLVTHLHDCSFDLPIQVKYLA